MAEIHWRHHFRIASLLGGELVSRVAINLVYSATTTPIRFNSDARVNAMNQRPGLVSLGFLGLAVILGILLGESHAQPKPLPQVSTPMFLKLDNQWINLVDVRSAKISADKKSLSLAVGDRTTWEVNIEPRNRGRALVEWLDAHSFEPAPEAPKNP